MSRTLPRPRSVRLGMLVSSTGVFRLIFIFGKYFQLYCWNRMLLSILIPVYNERTVVERSLSLVLAAPLPENMERELVVIDDCSTDGTSEILKRLADGEPRIRLFRHEVNQGKGAALRTAIAHSTGDFCLVQDAD